MCRRPVSAPAFAGGVEIGLPNVVDSVALGRPHPPALPSVELDREPVIILAAEGFKHQNTNKKSGARAWLCHDTKHG